MTYPLPEVIRFPQLVSELLATVATLNTARNGQKCSASSLHLTNQLCLLSQFARSTKPSCLRKQII